MARRRQKWNVVYSVAVLLTTRNFKFLDQENSFATYVFSATNSTCYLRIKNYLQILSCHQAILNRKLNNWKIISLKKIELFFTNRFFLNICYYTLQAHNILLHFLKLYKALLQSTSKTSLKLWKLCSLYVQNLYSLLSTTCYIPCFSNYSNCCFSSFALLNVH